MLRAYTASHRDPRENVASRDDGTDDGPSGREAAWRRCTQPMGYGHATGYYPLGGVRTYRVARDLGTLALGRQLR